MARAWAFNAAVVMCLAIGSAIAAEPQFLPAVPPEPPADEILLPPRVQTICKKAKDDLKFMCAEYERLYREVEMGKLAATKKLKALTRGGVIEVLQ